MRALTFCVLLSLLVGCGTSEPIAENAPDPKPTTASEPVKPTTATPIATKPAPPPTPAVPAIPETPPSSDPPAPNPGSPTTNPARAVQTTKVVEIPLDEEGKVEIRMVRIPAGTFTMGSPENASAGIDENPQREVTITRDFWLSETEVTQSQWTSLMGTTLTNQQNYYRRNDGRAMGTLGVGPRKPMYFLPWAEANKFCEKLAAKMGKKLGRLATEAEWEYALRAGTTTKFHFGDNHEELDDYAWTARNRSKLMEVGMLEPNSWGLYDMMGNTCEWCYDWYSDDYYSKGEKVDPRGPESGTMRVIRGGSWIDRELPRSARRGKHDPSMRRLAVLRDAVVGFRACVIEDP